MKEGSTEAFARRMRMRRKALGLTQRAIAERLGYSEKAISKWESAVALPPSNVLPSLADALVCSIDELLGHVMAGDYYLGIDGGGTKTDFCLTDSEGRLVKRVMLGASNPVDIGIERTLGCLEEGIKRVTDGVPLCRISAYAGIAGGSAQEYRRAVRDYLLSLGLARAESGSDADSIVEAGLYVDGEARDGLVVIMGTGSVAFLRKDGVKTRFGGYGYLLGDMGCGFSLGRDSILAALNAEQGTAEATIISDLIKAKTGKPRTLDSLADFYREGKRGIAAYARLALEAYDRGDALAKRIVENNAAYIAALISGALSTVKDASVRRVVIAGGLTARSDVFIPLIKRGLRGDTECEITVYNESVVKGALLLAGATNLPNMTT